MNNHNRDDKQACKDLNTSNTHPPRDVQPDGLNIIDNIKPSASGAQQHTRVVVLQSLLTESRGLCMTTIELEGSHSHGFVSEFSYRHSIILRSTIHGKRQTIRLSWEAATALQAALDAWKEDHPFTATPTDESDPDDMTGNDLPF